MKIVKVIMQSIKIIIIDRCYHFDQYQANDDDIPQSCFLLPFDKQK